jgi:hypothetical protein
MFASLGDSLNSKLPSWIGSIFNSIIQVFTVEVGVLPRDLEGFILEKAVNPEFRNEVKLDKVSLALVIQKSVYVDAEALHHAE